MRPEQIPYGVKDFKRIRLENRCYAVGTPVHFLCYEFKGRDLLRLEEFIGQGAMVEC